MISENDIVLCTVKRIEGTTVFLELDDGTEGTMIFSEVSPGRIRNIREYVVPNKKVVCKVLRIQNGHPQLSLRRVTAGERDELMERYKKEKILTNMIKPVLKDKTLSVLEKIKSQYDLSDFLDEARENPKLIEKFATKTQASELQKIFSEKREKEKIVKKKIKITSQSESGILDIKKALHTEDANIYYLGSSKFSVEVKAKDYKTANHKLEDVLKELEEKAKSLKLRLDVKEK